MHDLKEFIKAGPYQGYSYSYPHKSAYRPFEPKLAMDEVWKDEKKSSLFLYLHIPFCEMRCGFCNLFTMANPKDGMENPYLPALKRQINSMNKALGEGAEFARLAIGGGTPSFLKIEDLEKMFDLIHNDLGLNHRVIPASMEVSPKTVTAEKLALMHARGINRVSIGIQSFFEEETNHLGRPQKLAEVEKSLDLIKAANFQVMNLDFIYGGAGQTETSWIASLKRALDWTPEEIFLYPLYVRPLTGLGKKTDKEWADFRLNLYRKGRAFLLENGYEQTTMRIFRRKEIAKTEGPAYNSPEDGMVGLGVGARSYTRKLHYSSDYAVGRKGVKNIIHHYNEQEEDYFGYVYNGVRLTEEEQKRRYVIKSLLEGENLNLNRYQAFFESNVFQDLPELNQLLTNNFATEQDGLLQLNPAGLELSDAIGPWLYSSNIQHLMKKYELV